jgi:hypothetical protein
VKQNGSSRAKLGLSQAALAKCQLQLGQHLGLFHKHHTRIYNMMISVEHFKGPELPNAA